MFYDNFVSYCNSVNRSPSAVASELGLSRASVNGWKNGKTPTDANQIKIANYFGTSVDELMSEQKEKPALTKEDERDIKVKIDEIIDMMAQQKGLMFDGDPLTPDAIESIRNAMELGMTAAKMKNKEEKHKKE